VADSHDKLATSGDFVAKAWEGGNFRAEIQEEIRNIDDMPPYAVELVAFLDAATKKEANKKRNTQLLRQPNRRGTCCHRHGHDGLAGVVAVSARV
jgi:hypothetical protein